MTTNDKHRLSVLDTYLNVQLEEKITKKKKKKKAMRTEETRRDRLSKLIRRTEGVRWTYFSSYVRNPNNWDHRWRRLTRMPINYCSRVQTDRCLLSCEKKDAEKRSSIDRLDRGVTNDKLFGLVWLLSVHILSLIKETTIGRIFFSLSISIHLSPRG